MLYSARMNAHNPGDKLAVSTREAAQMLSVSPRTIQNYFRAKMLPSRKIGRRTVIPVRALENFLRTGQPWTTECANSSWSLRRAARCRGSRLGL